MTDRWHKLASLLLGMSMTGAALAGEMGAAGLGMVPEPAGFSPGIMPVVGWEKSPAMVPPAHAGEYHTMPEFDPSIHAPTSGGVAGPTDVPPTVGIRLDTSFGLFREAESGVYASEHQHVGAAGGTILPFQCPCIVTGVRALGVWTENLSMIDDAEALSLDAFVGTRYKASYLKASAFWDVQEDQFGKIGFGLGLLTRLPFIGNMTFDGAFAWGTGNDLVDRTVLGPVPFRRARLIEVCDTDIQLRVGKFLCPEFQTGFTLNQYAYESAFDEWGAGAFFAVHKGRFSATFDVTGGDEGLRGFLTGAISLGKDPCRHPRDCHYNGVDTVEWVTRTVRRDISIRLRDSFNGPLP